MSGVRFTPRAHQRKLITFALTHPGCNWWSSMGSGKTSAALAVINWLLVCGAIDRALIVAPLLPAKTTWPDEVGKFIFPAIKMAVACGNPEKRLAVLQSDANVIVINYDNLPWLYDQGYDHWGMCVADESTRLKGFRLKGGTKQAQALAKISRDYHINMTGTPSPLGIIDLWGQQFFLDAGERLGRTYTVFQDRWLKPVPDGTGYGFNWIPRYGAEQEVAATLEDCTITIDLAEYMDVLEPLRHTIWVDLPPKAQKIYNEFEKEMFVELESGNALEVTAAGSKFMKCLQLTGGAAIWDTETGDWEEVHTAKLDALESVIEEAAGSPILVAYQFRHEVERILKRFKQAVHITSKNAAECMKRFNAGEIPVLVGHPASMGHGLSLAQGGHIIVFYSDGCNLEHRLQIIERIGPARQAQLGRKQVVSIIDIRAKGTVDRVTERKHKTKEGTLRLLLDYTKNKDNW